MRKGFVFLLFFLVTHVSYSQSISPKGPVNICTGETQVLKVDGAKPNETFQWQKDGVDIPGATKDSYQANTGGDYTVLLRREFLHW